MIEPMPRLPMSKALRAAIAEATDYPCELWTIPRVESTEGTRVAVDPPYTILYPMPSTRGGTYGRPLTDASWSYQATLVSARGDQLDWLYDRLSRFLLARQESGAWVHPLDIDGMNVYDREIATENGGESSGVDTKVGIITYDVRFVIHVSPQKGPST